MHDNIYANPEQYAGLHAGRQSDKRKMQTKAPDSPFLHVSPSSWAGASSFQEFQLPGMTCDACHASPEGVLTFSLGPCSGQCREPASPREFVHQVDKVTCPKPCTVSYEHFNTPKVLDPAYQTMKGCLSTLCSWVLVRSCQRLHHSCRTAAEPILNHLPRSLAKHSGIAASTQQSP